MFAKPTKQSVNIHERCKSDLSILINYNHTNHPINLATADLLYIEREDMLLSKQPEYPIHTINFISSNRRVLMHWAFTDEHERNDNYLSMCVVL